MTFICEDNSEQNTIAVLNLYVSLSKNNRGTHMSRCLEIINQQTWILSSFGLADLAQICAIKLDSDSSYLEATFPFFLILTAIQ